jgi:small GTP-binding protein
LGSPLSDLDSRFYDAFSFSARGITRHFTGSCRGPCCFSLLKDAQMMNFRDDLTDNYNGIKQALFAAVGHLSGIVRKENAKALVAIEAKLREETFNLVVLGQFKRGKSTFINALLGADILPTAIVPLTSVVTVLRYGQEMKVIVHYLEGHHEEIALSMLPDYITERANPENHKRVKEVEVFYPSEYLKGGVRIIDTPGTGSVYRHNTDAAYAYLPQADASIFIISADPPLSESERQFLRDAREHVSKLFFVLNKIDQVNEEELGESLAFTRQVLEKDLGTGLVRIQPLSARIALDAKINNNDTNLERSLLTDFEKRLQAFLVHEKGSIFLLSVINNLLKLASDTTIAFQLEQKALKLPVEELTAKIARFEEEIRNIEKDREHNQYLLRGHTSKITGQLEDEIGLFKREKLPILHEAVEAEYLNKTRQGAGNLREDLESFVFARIQEVFNSWRQQLTEKISGQLEETHQEFASKANETTERILVLTSNVFELDLVPFTVVEKLNKKSEFYFLLKDDPVGIELIRLAVTSALPGFMTKKIILKNMKNSVSDLLERHCGRIRYDLVRRINSTVHEFQQSLNEKIDLTLEGIRYSFQRALAMNQESKAEVERDTAAITQKLMTLSDVQGELAKYRLIIDSMVSVGSGL